MKHVWLCGASECVSFQEGNTWREVCKEWFKDYSDVFTAWNPNDYYRYDKQLHKTDSEVFRFCLNKVRKADVILVNLSNIRKSVGSIVELALAYFLHKEIIGFYECEEDPSIDDLKQIIHSWVYDICNRIETGKNAMVNSLYYINNYFDEEY